MEQQTVARSYATALFELGERTGEHEVFTRAFQAVNGSIAADRRIGDFLRSPKIALDEKKAVLSTVFGDRTPRLFMNFLLVVLDKRRHRLLPAIASEYGHMLDKRLGRLNVSLTLAREPDGAELTEVTERLSKALDKSVIPHVHVEPEILGGIIVRYGDHVMDGSLRRRLLRMRSAMLAAPLADTVL